MVDKHNSSSPLSVSRSLRIGNGDLAELQFGAKNMGLGLEPAVRLRFTNAAGGFNNSASQTLSIPQLLGIVAFAAQDLSPADRLDLIAAVASLDSSSLVERLEEETARWTE